MKFKPRGIIKWHPFNAVDDMVAAQYEVDRINNIKPQPELSIDQLENLQRDIETAFLQQAMITIHYYEEHAIQSVTGIISKIDLIAGCVYIDRTTVELISICYILGEI
ncbi:YolD-like family protein [Culicoidibacter larvae]|uniref:YolD-like family protein n=1 Tax=Culicoidibacter larvae TaxID=2579976 RepID=A0A5R8Q9R8_9FIRM|nr:YolD-like family protein [Culicoidibacter larvae]TLG72153.1 YolD-like family protein [Culicoidibacter larvae]